MEKSAPVLTAILKWPNGLGQPPIIWPAGETDENDRAIVTLLEKHLGRRER